MHKKGKYKYMWLLAILLLVLGIGMYFVHPYAPLLLVLTLAIQVPIIMVVYRSSAGNSYVDRAGKRREEYEKDGDAQKWLDGEVKETKTPGFETWSKTGLANSALNRAQALTALGRTDEANELLKLIEPRKLEEEAFMRLEKLVRGMKKNELDGKNED